MTNDNNKKSISESILEKIKSGKIKMHSRAYFALRTILIAFLAAVVAGLAAYLISFAVFVLKINGGWAMPSFGWLGMRHVLYLAPWAVIIAVFVFVVAAEILARKFSFSYHRPVIYSLFALVAMVLAGALFIYKAPLNRGMFMSARENRLPIAGGMYRGYGLKEFKNIHHGVITDVNENGFVMQSRDRILIVATTSNTKFPQETTFEEGDRVIVIGEEEATNFAGPIINASGIRVVDDDLDDMRMMPRLDFPPMPQGRPR